MSDAKTSCAASRPSKIYFLLSVYAHYWGGLFKALSKERPDCEIVVVHFDQLNSEQVSHQLSAELPATFIRRSALNRTSLLALLERDSPAIIYISGWVDKDYLYCVRRYKARNRRVAVVCGIDDHWKGTLRQHLGVLYFAAFYRRVFDFMWVSGKPQYHYAQRFGYDHLRIVSNLLSAESVRFDRPTPPSRRFVFVGRFVRVKALDVLIDAYRSLPKAVRRDWALVLIGDGPEADRIREIGTIEENVHVKPFLNQELLLRELQAGGVCCMPSRSEAWGVAVHEMALLGYPLILSSACGAATEFLISGYNGYLFRSEDPHSLRRAMERIAGLPEETRRKFSERSNQLGRRITNEFSAHSLLSTEYLLDV